MRSFIFYIMSTFRWLIVATSYAISAFMIFVLVFYMFNGTSNQIVNLIITFFVAVIFGAFSWNYETLLEILEPKDSANEMEENDQ